MFQDLRYGLRMLWRSPAFTLAAVLSLAIGIGATSAIFSVVNGVVLRPLPYQQPEQLLRLWQSKPQIGMTQMPISGGNVQVWRERAQSFAGVAAFSTTQAIFTRAAEPEVVRGARVSANLLPLLGYQPMLGRGFLPIEDQPGNHAVILLSHKLWQRRFGGDPDIVGRAVALDHTNNYTIVGVLPPQANFPGESEFWITETTTAQGRHDTRSLNVIARLKPGVTWQTAENELQLIHKQLQQQFAIVTDINQFGLDKEHKPTFYVPFRQEYSATLNLLVHTTADPAALLPALRARILAADKFTAITRVRTLEELVSASIAQPRFYALLLALFAAIALVLAVIGIYGVISDAVSRRTHEIGIRLALGAEAGRLQRLIAGQGMLPVGVGIAVGLLAARLLTRALADLLFGVKPTDPATFVVIAAVLAGAALLACWMPARRAAQVDPLVALRHE